MNTNIWINLNAVNDYFGKIISKQTMYNSSELDRYRSASHKPPGNWDHSFCGESVALLVARRTNNQPTIGRLRVRGPLK